MASKRFTKVSPAIWRSTRFNSLPDDVSRLLLFYYLTCEHQTSAGCCSIPDGYAAADLGWSLQQYAAARATLITAGMVEFDVETSTLYILGWFKHCPPMNKGHAAGIEKMLAGLEPSPARDLARAEFEQAERIRCPVEDNVRTLQLSPGLRNSLARGGL